MPKSKKPRHAYKRKIGTNFWNVREENLDIIRENFARLELKSLINLEQGNCEDDDFYAFRDFINWGIVALSTRDDYADPAEVNEACERLQLAKTQEELKELDEAISLLLTLEMGTIEKKSAVYKSNRDNLIDHIAEELADVRIMLDQIAFGLGIEKSCAEWRELKINRQLKRMEME